MDGLISHIQRFSLHDGPGIRTTVFLKGCNLRCAWCHNPETQRAAPEIQFLIEKCAGCGQCVRACSLGAHGVAAGRHVFNRELCAGCGRCAQTCYAQALVLVGRRMSPREVLVEVLRDRAYYRTSGGGMTLSGGEPLMQSDFSAELMRLCKAEGVHTAVQTNLAWPWERVVRVAETADLFMVDVKLMDGEAHRRWTGRDNAIILENLRRLAGRRIIVRTPVVAGINDSLDEIGRIARFVASLGPAASYELIACHPLGAGKYRGLGMPVPERLKAPDAQTMDGLVAEARRYGIEVRGPRRAVRSAQSGGAVGIGR